MQLSYQILNVFTRPGEPFSGNPLAVVWDPGLDTATCQRIARQFNLSECTFVALAASEPAVAAHAHGGAGAVDATVRIFTPTIELPFAGHPTLGTAHVVATELGASQVVLRMAAGDIPVICDGDLLTLHANTATVRESDSGAAELAAMIGLDAEQLVGSAWWVDSGIDQLLVQLRDADAVRAATPDAPSLRRLAMSARGEALCYVWAELGPRAVDARLFFSQDTAIVEDPATGSAAANLGGLLAWRGERGRRVTITQGAAVSRPSRLELEVTDTAAVRVGGLVRPIGGGALQL